MSHQRHLSIAETKEPHSVSLKVLRLARPSLMQQHPIRPLSPSLLPLPSPSPSPLPSQQPTLATDGSFASASLAYAPALPSVLNAASDGMDTTSDAAAACPTNADPFILSPVLAFPASFGSTYVGEIFSCSLCANNEIPPSDGTAASGAKNIRAVRIEAEIKTPSGASPTRLDLVGNEADAAIPGDTTIATNTTTNTNTTAGTAAAGVDLESGKTLQRVLKFHLREKGNHLLAATVSYYEATETSGRTRSFRKLYQFICRPALVVRTKVSALHADSTTVAAGGIPLRRWALEAQLENCSNAGIQLDRAFLELEPGLVYEDLNWDAVARVRGAAGQVNGMLRPLLRPGEVEQVCFVVSDDDGGGRDRVGDGGMRRAEETIDGRVMFGIMGVGWRGEMGSMGFLSTGRLGSRPVAAR